MEGLDFALRIADRLDAVWTFLLLMTRFTGLFLVLPGLGGGDRGIAVRLPGIVVLACASFNPQGLALLPANNLQLLSALAGELMLGFAIGLIPFMLVAGVQTAGHIMSTSMGLSAGNLIDPTLGVVTSDISRILGDLAIVLFLLVGGHHVAIHAVAGLGGLIEPGRFVVGPAATEVLIDRSGDIFRVGVMLAAPIMVALFLTNSVMGLISKAVPTVNIFVVSFPLTIGIGLILLVFALPDVLRFVGREVSGLENSIVAVSRDGRAPNIPAASQSFDASGQTGRQVVPLDDAKPL